jgi:hypothetical protein
MISGYYPKNSNPTTRYEHPFNPALAWKGQKKQVRIRRKPRALGNLPSFTLPWVADNLKGNMRGGDIWAMVAWPHFWRLFYL